MAKRLNEYLKLINEMPIVDSVKLQNAINDYQNGNLEALKIITEECFNIIPVIAKKYATEKMDLSDSLILAKTAFIDSISVYNFKKQGIKSEYFVFFIYDYVDAHMKFVTKRPEVIEGQKILIM